MTDPRPAHQLIAEYAEEPVISGDLRSVAPQAFAALEAVIELHRETMEEDAARGHWTGPKYEPDARWVRDRPAWCPIDDVALPCRTVQVIADKLS